MGHVVDVRSSSEGQAREARAIDGSRKAAAVLLLPQSWSSWKLHDRQWNDPDDECEDSFWTGHARSVGLFTSLGIEWVSDREIQAFVDEHFPDLDGDAV